MGRTREKKQQARERALTTFYPDYLFKNHATLYPSEGEEKVTLAKNIKALRSPAPGCPGGVWSGSPSRQKTGSVPLDAPSIFGSFQSTDAFLILPAPLPCQCVSVGIIGTDLFWSHHRTSTPVTLPSSLSFAFPIQFGFYHIDHRYDHRFDLPPYFLGKLLRYSESTRLKSVKIHRGILFRLEEVSSLPKVGIMPLE